MSRIALVSQAFSAKQASRTETAAPQSAQDPLVALSDVVGNDVMAAALAGDFMPDQDAPLGATVASGLARLAGLPQCDPYSSNQAMMRWMRHTQSESRPLDLGLATRLMSVSAGASLPEAIAQRLSTVFGHDLHHVRVHVDGSAARAAEAISARAFTVGNEIYFNAGEFQPGTPAGDSLLLHELTHVVQHDEGRTAGDRGVSSPNDPAELEAERVSRALLPDLQALEPLQPMDAGAPSWDVDDWMNEPVGSESDTISRQEKPEEEEDWSDTLIDILGDTLLGDFSEDQHIVAILLRALIGLIPYADQALDAEDICAALFKLLWEGRVDEPGVWLDLVLTIIGCIPELGSVIKGVGKAGLKLIGEASAKGARAIPIESLLKLIDDAAHKLDLDSQLKALRGRLDELAAAIDPKKIASTIEAKVAETLQTIITRGEQAREVVGLINDSAAKAISKIVKNARETQKILPKRIEQAVDQARRALGEMQRFVREELGQRAAKRSLGADEFARIERDLGPELTRTLCGALDGQALQLLHKKVGADELRRLGRGMEPPLLSNLCGKLGADGVVALGPDRMIRLFGDMRRPLDEVVTRLSKAQLDALSKLDQKVLDSLAANTPARKAELLTKVDDLLSASKWDSNFEKYPMGSGNMRHGHAVSKHGPQRSDQEMHNQAKADNDVASRWNSFDDLNKLVAAEQTKLYDVARQVEGNPHCILNKSGLQEFKKRKVKNPGISEQDIFNQMVSDSANHPHMFQKVRGFERIDAGRPIGTSFYPDKAISKVNTYTVRFELASDGRYHLITAYPE